MFIFKAVAKFISAILVFLSTFSVWTGNTSYINIDVSDTGEKIVNIADNMNVYSMGKSFYKPEKNSENNVFEFVRYIQLMQCTGGNEDRDLFIDPYDTSTYTDYNFKPLIKNCKGILSLGAKPHLKLGNVPMKFSKDYEIGSFGVNVYPPDDYNIYYNYIRDVAQALVDEFGVDEVKTWRFGCMTEYENSDWFMARSKTPEDSFIQYCKLYDYTVQALIDVIGEDVFVGAHSMTVTEGLWDEVKFIEHVAKGTNYANGKTGTRICFLSASFYDSKPGKFTPGYTLPETLAYLKNAAEENGLNNLIYGIDEGRILEGNSEGNQSAELIGRACGYTWQAAYDARLYLQAINSGADYFSSWGNLSGGIINGYPTVSYHVSKNIAAFAGSERAEAKVVNLKADLKAETDCLAGYNESSGTLHVMAYNFKNDIKYKKKTRLKFKITVPEFEDGEVTLTKYIVNDDCNFFDEWQNDRVTYNITDSCFKWSPDDPMIDSKSVLENEEARDVYESLLRDKYIECSRLVPVTVTAEIKNGILKFTDDLDASSVIFYEITKA